MAFDLSFGPEFFVGPYDLTIEYPVERPVTIYQALSSLSEESLDAIVDHFDDLSREMVTRQDLTKKVQETNTCTDLRSPVEVWIDREGYCTILVHEKEGD